MFKGLSTRWMGNRCDIGNARASGEPLERPWGEPYNSGQCCSAIDRRRGPILLFWCVYNDSQFARMLESGNPFTPFSHGFSHEYQQCVSWTHFLNSLWICLGKHHPSRSTSAPLHNVRTNPYLSWNTDRRCQNPRYLPWKHTSICCQWHHHEGPWKSCPGWIPWHSQCRNALRGERGCVFIPYSLIMIGCLSYQISRSSTGNINCQCNPERSGAY